MKIDELEISLLQHLFIKTANVAAARISVSTVHRLATRFWRVIFSAMKRELSPVLIPSAKADSKERTVEHFC